MKNLSILARVGISLVGLLVAIAPGAELDEQSWSAGYAEADITPGPRQVQMSGFGRERYADGALAPLLTQTIVLRDGGNRTGVLITADVDRSA